jgi:isoleucyl-tRNA synthetase
MPYGMNHYPFENTERFEATFPAKFIAEGLDQTRGWFYTLIVLSTALFDRPPFENCVVNGLILAEDGRKMSKSLKNYPDPAEVFDVFGADALRAFLINSPVLRAEPLRFSKEGVADVVRTVLLPLWNTYSFFTTYAEADGIAIADFGAAPPADERPEMDRWILSVLQSLVEEVNTQMEGYYLYNVVPPILGFIDYLTNWYVRRTRRRFWRARGESKEADKDKLAAFATLYEVLTTFVEVLAPILPFISEHLYQDLIARHDPGAVRSVHHRDFPEARESLIDTELERSMAVAREVVRLGRTLRKREGHRVRQPLAGLTILTHDPEISAAVDAHADLIAEELNVKQVSATNDEGALVRLSAKANFRKLGPALGSEMQTVATGIAALTDDELAGILDGGLVEVAGHPIALADLIVERTPIEGVIVETGADFACALDTTLDEILLQEGIAREIVSQVQRLRREAGLDVVDRIVLSWHSADPEVETAFGGHHDVIAGEVLAKSVIRSGSTIGEKFDLDGHEVWLAIEPDAA